MTQYRIEKDSLGEYKVPADAWYGIQTARAIDNFPVSGRLPDADFVRAHVTIKLAAARANLQPGWLDQLRCDAIVAACERILNGEFVDQFVVDRFQAGAGTWTRPARGAARGISAATGPFAIQLATRAPRSSPNPANHAASRPSACSSSP